MQFTSEEQSQVGALIDMPMDTFKNELVNQQVNVGIMSNMVHLLSSVYSDLNLRRNEFVKRATENIISKDEAKLSLEGVYAEMIKVEEKIVYLKKRISELSSQVGV